MGGAPAGLGGGRVLLATLCLRPGQRTKPAVAARRQRPAQDLRAAAPPTAPRAWRGSSLLGGQSRPLHLHHSAEGCRVTWRVGETMAVCTSSLIRPTPRAGQAGGGERLTDLPRTSTQSTLPLGQRWYLGWIWGRILRQEQEGFQIFNEKSQSQRLAGSQRGNSHSLPGRERGDRSQPNTTCLTTRPSPSQQHGKRPREGERTLPWTRDWMWGGGECSV